MRSVKAVGLEALLVAAIGVLFGVTANALSPRGLSLGRNYFPDTSGSAQASKGAVDAAEVRNAVTHPKTAAQRLHDRGLQLASADEMIRLFRDPRYKQGLVLFIDAREDQQYTLGHIPGARQFDHYRPEKHVATVLPACLIAQQVVVYCGGGECEDSEFAAMMLRDAGVPAEKLFVYPGGFTEWTSLGLAVETGSRPGPKS